MLGEFGPFSKITAMIDGSHVLEGGGVGGGAHQTAETVDMARLAEPPVLPLLPQGCPLTFSCPASAYRSLCADTAWTLVSHSFDLRLEEPLNIFTTLNIHD